MENKNTNEDKKNNVLKPLEDITFVFESGKMNAVGHRWVNNKQFQDVMDSAREQLLEQMEKAIKVEENEQRIIQNAEKEASNMVQEVEDYLNRIDIVKEANRIADAKILEAQKEAEELMRLTSEKAEKMIREAEETKMQSIEYGEKTKTKLINQGYEFLEEKIQKTMTAVNNAQKEMDTMKSDLGIAYDDVLGTLEADEEEQYNEERKNA